MNSAGASHLYSTIYDNEDLVDWRQFMKLYTWYNVSCWSDCLLMQTDENLYC